MSSFLKFRNGSKQMAEEINITSKHMKTLSIISMLRNFEVGFH